jgi:hypothetical protein
MAAMQTMVYGMIGLRRSFLKGYDAQHVFYVMIFSTSIRVLKTGESIEID